MDPNALAGMLGGLWDSPMISQVAYHPTTFPKGTDIGADQTDGTIAVEDGVELAYRLYHGCSDPKFVLLYFHANAEASNMS